MSSAVSATSILDTFLVLELPRQRASHWSQALSPLDDPDAPVITSIAAFYDAQRDQALIGLRFSELATDAPAYVTKVTRLAEIGLIQLAALSGPDRQRFFGERVSRCAIVVEHHTAVGAFGALVKKIRNLKQTATVIGSVSRTRRARTPAARASLTPAVGAATTEHLHVTPKGTRDHLERTVERPVLAKATRDDLPRQSGSPDNAESSKATPPGIIHARYLRSGKWVPIRIGALSLKGAALLSGALPRAGDQVDLAFAYAEHRALVRGPVQKISTVAEAAATGAPTFSVQFDLDDTARRELTTLLTAARDAQVTIKPPPARSTRRYPVEWPVCLGTMRGAIRGEALDISYGGMFVRPGHPLQLDTTLSFSVVLDDGGAPISGRAKVVRHVAKSDARTFGLEPGYGLNISDMSDVDLDRWMKFLSRIEKRADKRVLVGASPERLVEIQEALASIGYAVTGGTDPNALVDLSEEGRAVDAVLLDGDWLPNGKSAALMEALFASRSVPCITVHGDARRGRNVVDKLLSIS